MKKALSLFLAVCLLLAIGAVALFGRWNRATITLCSQENVISDRVLQTFTKKTGIQVQYRLLEELEASDDPAGCDLLLADPERLSQLMEEGQLTELDWDRLASLPEIDPSYLGLSFDPENRYTVPGLWTTMGLLYNPTRTETRVTGWVNLFDGQFSGSLVMPEDSQTSFAVALTALGLDVNTQSSEDLTAAANYLTQQQPQVAAYRADSQLADAFQSGQAILAPCYAGVAIELMSQLPELSFVIPSEGSWRALLSYAIPANAQQEEAYQLLNYLCQKDSQAKNGVYSGYSVVSPKAFDLLDSAWRSNPLAYPAVEQLERFPFLLGQTGELCSERQARWHKIQASMNQETTAQYQAEPSDE